MNIRDIAELARVSPSTVSKIINNKDESISEETRQRVLKVIKENQYVPYSKKKSIKTNIIGFVIEKELVNNNFIYTLEKELFKEGYSLLISYLDGSGDNLENILNSFHNKNIDGLIYFVTQELINQMEIYCSDIGIPFLSLNCTSLNNNQSVYHDDESAGYIATDYLISLGHKNIIFLGKENQSENTIKGYRRAFYSNDMINSDNLIYLLSNKQNLEKIEVDSLIASEVSAILIDSLDIGLYFIKRLKKSGIRIPKDISIITLFYEEFNEQFYPRLSGIKRNDFEISKKAVKLLINSIENRGESTRKNIPVSPTLVLRESTSIPLKIIHTQKKIVAVGSLNMDVTIKTDGIIKSGETITAKDTYHIPGGKGANQAIGVSKLGAKSYLIGYLGNDNYGRKIMTTLQENDVNVEGVMTDSNLTSGKAYINVFEEGESAIVVYSGANQTLNDEKIRENIKIFDEAEFCLLSTEIPNSAIIETIKICDELKIPILLKPSAGFTIDDKWISKIDYLIPNEKELKNIVIKGNTIKEKSKYLYKKGAKNVIVTLGSEGLYLLNDSYDCFIDSADFNPIDTTGAADAFISALAVFMSEGNDLLSSLSYAIYSAGISVTKLGAQSSLPNRMELSLYSSSILKFKRNLERKCL